MALERTYTFDVDGIGTFVFRRRTMAHRYSITAAALKIMGTGEVTNLGLLAETEKMAEVQLLCVSAPEGWNVEDMDPLDPEEMRQFGIVHARFREAEETFRRGAAAKRPGVGSAAK